MAAAQVAPVHSLKKELSMSLLVPLTLPAALFVTLLTAELSRADASHPPNRPLPVPSKRPADKGPAYYTDPAKGDDTGDGSLAKPWKTLAHAVQKLQPGDTLYLRGGIYFEHVVMKNSGTADKPITIRSQPGELAILQGGLREFWDHPEQAWEPCPGGAAGEYWSTKTYPDLGGTVDGVNVLGRFGDSMLPLHGYRFLADLRSDNMYWNLPKNTAEDEKGIYCGPGMFYDVKTGRIHIRLAHTTLPGLHEDNYRGEKDPRKLKLIVAGFQGGAALTLRGVQHVRLLDLVVRGSRGPTIEIHEGADIEIDGLTIYAGSTCFQVRDTVGLRVLNTACRGIAAPWTFRGSLKYRSIEARIFSAGGWDPTGIDNRNFEFAYCEFTDSVDGVFIGNVKGVRFHHNLLDNVSDDGLFLTAATAFDGTTHGGDVHIYQNLLSRCLTTFAFGVGHGRQKVTATGRQTGSGVFIYRNVFDYRRPVMYHQPTSPTGPQEITSKGRFASDHGSPAWEPMTIYHNTILADDPATYAYGTAGVGNAVGRGTQRRVFNNIIVQLNNLPGSFFPPPGSDLQADANLLWSVQAGPDFKGDLFAKFRKKGFEESKKVYPPGWGQADLFADPKFVRFDADWKASLDLRLEKGSPAAEAGLKLPESWADPVQSLDKGKPDLGAIPLGAEPWRVGVQGRLTMFGQEKSFPVPPALSPPAFPSGHRLVRQPFQGKPAAIVRGYPAFDGPYMHFVLKKHGIPTEVFDKSGSWLDTKEYARYGMVTVVGSLVRAKIEPNKYTKEDLQRVQAYLEQGGTLLLMRVGSEVFGSLEGREFLGKLTNSAPGSKLSKVENKMRLQNHPWLKHLDEKEDHPWLNTRLAIPWRMNKGEALVGNETGDQATLYRLPVGKGQLIYLGWEISEYMPTNAPSKPPTVDQERIFEEQIGILERIVESVYPAGEPGASATGGS
jgi:hypothetical protein